MGRKINLTRENLRKLVESGLPEGKKQVEYSDSKTSGLSMVHYASGNLVFYFSLSYRKRRYRDRLGDAETLKISEVRCLANEMRAAIQKGLDPIGTRKMAQMLFKDLVTLYQAETKAKKLSWDSDDSKFRNYLLPYFGSKQLGAITRTSIERYHTQLTEKLSAASANRHLSLLKAIFTHSVDKLRVLKESPARGIANFPEKQVQRKYFNSKELQLLLAELELESNLEAQNILKFMLLTGCRRNTARTVKLEHYDAYNDTLLVEMTKSGVGQYLVLSEPAKAIIEQQCLKHGCSGLIFRGIDMKSQISCPSAVLKRVCRKAGLQERGCHAMRHTFAVQLLELGCSSYQLQVALNQRCSSSTAVYSAISNQKLSQISNDYAKTLGL